MKKFWISMLTCSVCTFLIAWSRGIFLRSDPKYVFHILSDSFMVVGMLAAGIGALLFVSNEGVFDIFRYGLQAFFSFFRKDMSRKYDTFYDYKVARQEKKNPFLFLLASGGIFLLMAAVTYMLYCKYV